MLYYHYNYTRPDSTYHVTLEGDTIEVTVRLPGVKKKNIDIKYSEEDNGIYVNVKDGAQHYIPMQRAIEVDKIEAELDLGILTITIPIKDTQTNIQIK